MCHMIEFALLRYPFFKLPEGFNTSTATSHAANQSRQRLPRNYIRERHPTATIPIANKRSTRSSSAFEKATSKLFGLWKRRSRALRMSIIPQEHVVPITPRIYAPQQYSSKYPASPGHSFLCSDEGQASENCLVVLLEFLVSLFHQRMSNSTTAFGQISITPTRWRQYQRGTAAPSAYQYQPSVPQHSNSNPLTPTGHQGGTTRTSAQTN